MAKIAIAWELGGGLGHLVRYRSLVDLLLEAGHSVSFLVRDVGKAQSIFRQSGPEFHQVYPGETPQAQRLPAANSFAEVLFNCGFHDPTAVAQRVAHWLNVLQSVQPEVMIADYSPTGLLAARIRNITTVVSGNGFYVPPNCMPMPPLRYWLSCDRKALASNEQRVVTVVNQVLAGHQTGPVRSVAELYATADRFLLTFAELDHCFERPAAEYFGSYPSPGFGAAPQWPLGAGPCLFAYLDPQVLFDELLDAFKLTGARVCLYAPGCDERVRARCGELQNLVLMQMPVDLAAAAATCDAALTNANINTMTGFLLQGKPQLVVPYTLEKYLVGRRLELLGAGLSAPRGNPGDIAAKLRAVLTQRAYRRFARQFAQRHAGETGSLQAQRMLQRIERLLDCGEVLRSAQ